MTLVDSHCHIDGEKFDADRDAVIERALAAGVDRMVVIGGIAMAERYPFIHATAGVHPHEASAATPETFKKLREDVRHPKVVWVGEIGLDYHYDFSPRDVQAAVFIEHMRIAAEARKPIVIHTREAWADTIQLIRDHWTPTGLPGIMHCFTAGPAEAREALDLGFYLSFGGVVTFPKALELQEAAKIVPADRLLVETDSPYLAPVPYRGKRNEPAFVVEVARKLAALRGVTPEQIAADSNANFARLC